VLHELSLTAPLCSPVSQLVEILQTKMQSSDVATGCMINCLFQYRVRLNQTLHHCIISPARPGALPMIAHHASQMLAGQLVAASCCGVHAAPVHRSAAKAASSSDWQGLADVGGLIREVRTPGHPAACRELHVLGARGMPAVAHLPANDRNSCASDGLHSCDDSADSRWAAAGAQQPVGCRAAQA
jgi:hypothetical protein